MPEFFSTYTPIFVLAVDSQSSGLVGFIHPHALWIGFSVMAITAALILLFAGGWERLTGTKQKTTQAQTGNKVTVSVFEELCACHGLNDDERRLLESANKSTADSAAYLFVDPKPLRKLASETNDVRYADLVNRLFPESAAAPA